MSSVPLAVIDAAALDRVIRTYAEVLGAHREAINRLNVYPVPDGDTGTNMGLTLEAVVAELDEASPDGPGSADLATACRAISHGSLMGARGNSGVILSQILRGLCDVVRDADGAVGPAELVTALRTASDAARGAVMKPVEGTILTVAADAASAAEQAAAEGADLETMLVATRQAAQVSLDHTPELLPVLAEAGVVDAGGAGLVLLIDSLLHVVAGVALPEPDLEAGDGVATMAEQLERTHATQGDGDIAGLRYEVMFFLEAPDHTVPAFKDVWAGIGDSIVVVGGDGLWNCHIHTDDIGASIEAAIDCGRPRQIRITDLLEQVEEERWVREATVEPEQPAHANERVTTAVVAVATGAGISRIFYSLGVQRIVKGGQTMNPSTAQLVEAVESAPADDVVILPNNKNIIPVAEQVDAQTSKSVSVVGTRGIAEGFASLLSYDPEASGADNAKAMDEAAQTVVAAEVTQAVRDSTCDVGLITKGHWLGICRDGIRAVAPTVDEVCVQLLEVLVAPTHELVTIIEGDGATPATTRRIEVWLNEHRAGVGTEVHHGGQPLYPYLFGIE